MQLVVSGVARVMKKFMGTSGAETLSAASNIFVGQTEAPLVVKPFVETMTKSEIHAVMVGGFATVAGGVMAAYTNFGIDPGHLLTASVMSAPASLVAAKLFFPETEQPVTGGGVSIKFEKQTCNIFDAACVGAADGMRLVLNVAAMLLAFISLIALVDYGLGKIADGLSLGKMLGWLFYPVCVAMGIEWADCAKIGELLGLRMAVNEFIAYIKLGNDIDMLSPRSTVLATYAFCGFANFSSIAIQIGGISSIAPGRRSDLARLGLRAMLAGTLASFFTANIVGFLLSEDEILSRHVIQRAKAYPRLEYGNRLKVLKGFSEKYPGSSEIKRLQPHIDAVTQEASQYFEKMKAEYMTTKEKGDREAAAKVLRELVKTGIPEHVRFATDEIQTLNSQ
jgi:CNT family concentrative nucleoside transporter